MAARKFAIPTDAADALRTATAYDGPRVTITRQLSADEWRGVKTVLEKLGAEYVPGKSAFEFEPDQDARTLVMAALAAGHVMAASASHGFVATPDGVAVDLVNQYGEIRPVRGRKLSVLEPSAGRGPWVRAVLGDDSHRVLSDDAPQWLHVTAIEVDARRARYIPESPAVTAEVSRFEDFHTDTLTRGLTFDRVIMNPPFSVPGRPMLWADHVLLAWELLAPGGRLVAVVPAAVLHHRVDKRHRAVRELIEHHGGAEELDRSTFAESGILVQTAVVWLDRPYVDQVDEVTRSAFYGREFAYDLYPYTGAETPVDVDRLTFTRAAALHTPVQVWWDSWRNRSRIMRYVADCCECGRPTWGFDDGEDAGIIDHSTATLDAAAYDRVGPSVGFCFLCGNKGDGGKTYNRALDRAKARWTEPVPVDADDAGYVSPWATLDAA